MAKTIPIAEAENFFRTIAKSIEREAPKILLNGANVASAEFQFRLFNKGQAADLSVMHYKSRQYKRRRELAGLQTEHKDLYFTGDLFNSLKLLGAGGRTLIYGIPGGKQAQIAGYQETQTGKIIFNLAQRESDTAIRAMDADVERLVNRAIEAYPAMATLAPVQTPPKQTKTAARATKKGKKAVKKSVSRNKAKTTGKKRKGRKLKRK